MIRRIYVNNFRCLENFELLLSERPSTLLIGPNGAGKSTVGFALEILQKIARGTNRAGELVKPRDFAPGRSDTPMRFEIEVQLDNLTYSYSLAFEYPEGFREMRVFSESLTVSGKTVFHRELAKVGLRKPEEEREASFLIDWHLVALPIIQLGSPKDSVSIFKEWLGKILIFRPLPSLILGHSEEQTLLPKVDATDLGGWFDGLIAHAPSAYMRIFEFLKQVMPDLDEITNPKVGLNNRSLSIQFSTKQGILKLPFEFLSDGEKCFVLCGLVLAANRAYGPLACFWDEPDNYLAPDEIGHFVMALRRSFQQGGQFIATSHNPEAIRRFSDENTLLIYRKSHLEPTLVRPLDQVPHSGDLISSIVRGDLELQL